MMILIVRNVNNNDNINNSYGYDNDIDNDDYYCLFESTMQNQLSCKVSLTKYPKDNNIYTKIIIYC